VVLTSLGSSSFCHSDYCLAEFSTDPWMVSGRCGRLCCIAMVRKRLLEMGCHCRFLGGFTILVKLFAGFYVAGIMIAAVCD
jgi:hypothetical protein